MLFLATNIYLHISAELPISLVVCPIIYIIIHTGPGNMSKLSTVVTIYVVLPLQILSTKSFLVAYFFTKIACHIFPTFHLYNTNLSFKGYLFFINIYYIL